MPHLRSTIVAILLWVGVAAAVPLRYPTLTGDQTRIEVLLLPEVTTGPLDPAWSPDGQWIAFSMRGDVWKVPAQGGEAVALTTGPAYHFEPAWSPDGSRLAVSVDLDGNFDIGILPAAGGTVERLTSDPHIDVQPAWARDGKSVIFVTGRNRNLDIYRVDLPTRIETPVIAESRHQMQPSVSPDGRFLAYVAPVEGQLGTGGIWIKPVDGGTARLLHDEETSYRARPTWMPDGNSIVYVSDMAGSNDLAILAVNDGRRMPLTSDGMGEFSPAVSPDGRTVAFVSNRSGPTTLHTADVTGRDRGWLEVRISSRRSRVATGRLRGRVVGPGGEVTSARIHLTASDARAYAPDGASHRVLSLSETHYFHSQGTFEVDVPAGRMTIEALKGFEYAPASATIDVRPDEIAEIRLGLERFADPPANGWYSGDLHVHDLHQGRFGLTHDAFFLQSQAEDVRVTNALVHMDGTKLMGRWSDLTGAAAPVSTGDHILQYGEEFRGSLGHVGLIGVKSFVLPLTAGTGSGESPGDVLDGSYLDAARAQGGIAGFLHPYNAMVSAPRDGAGSAIPIDVALGKGDFYDVVSTASDELASAEMYYRFLNCGFRLPATGGSDNFSDAARNHPPGASRTYARIDGPLTFRSWVAAIAAGRTFGTNGPLVFLTVDGKGPGEQLRRARDAPSSINVSATVRSFVPIDTLEILVNGKVAEVVRADGQRDVDFKGVVTVAGSGWVAARVTGPPHRYVADHHPFAQTSAVYIVRDGAPLRSGTDAKFLLEVVEAIWKHVDQRNRWRTPAEKAAFRQAVEEAMATYGRLAGSEGEL